MKSPAGEVGVMSIGQVPTEEIGCLDWPLLIRGITYYIPKTKANRERARLKNHHNRDLKKGSKDL